MPDHSLSPAPAPAEPGFDATWYAETNPDVAAAVARGEIPSLLHHWQHHGRQEGRLPAPAPARSETGAEGEEPPLHVAAARHAGAGYLCPADLRRTEAVPRRILVVGSCLVSALGLDAAAAEAGCAADFVLTNNLGRLAPLPPADPASYDLQIVQIALRSVIPDATFWHAPFADANAYARLFTEAVERLRLQLDALLAWAKSFGIPTLVATFLVPQRNPLGRLMPRYDLRNPAYVIERLNAELERLALSHAGVHLLDLDAISASIGRRYVQDDAVAVLSHNALMELPPASDARMEPLAPMAAHYEVRWPALFAAHVWAEIVATHRTLRGADAVKLVVLDLDDTLWTGISGDLDAVGPEMVEGWPLGLAEALAYLRKRGVLIAILSRNDADRVRALWDAIFLGRLSLDDFATVRIGWEPKAETMRAMLAELNLLPRNAVFIDDNPAERAAMRAAFPDLRVLGRYPYYLRRILLWAPETQVPRISDEAARRTEMVRAQLARGVDEASMSREDFLHGLGLRVRLFAVAPDAPARARCLELLNRTNQFNTTGRRWRSEELDAAMRGGLRLLAFETEDRLTRYGLTGVVLVNGTRIEQFVMSCRVAGLGVEAAILAVLCPPLAAAGPVTAAFTETDANMPCRTLFPENGFTSDADGWRLDGPLPALPAHIAVEVA